MPRHLPPLPSDEVLIAVLPWWTRVLMFEAKKMGIQHHAAKVAKSLYRLQTAAEWTKDGVPAIIDMETGETAPWLEDYPQPDEDTLTAFRSWESLIVESFGAEQDWCDLFGKLAEATWKDTQQPTYLNDGYGVDGFDPDGYNRQGLDREGNPRPDGSVNPDGVRFSPPAWENVARARKW